MLVCGVVLQNSFADYQPGQYVACIYDNAWHIGNIVPRTDPNSDVLVNFMKRYETVRLSWPSRKDQCWVPFVHILCTVHVPQVEGASARQYRLDQKDYDQIVALYKM